MDHEGENHIFADIFVKSVLIMVTWWLIKKLLPWLLEAAGAFFVIGIFVLIWDAGSDYPLAFVSAIAGLITASWLDKKRRGWWWWHSLALSGVGAAFMDGFRRAGRREIERSPVLRLFFKA